MVWRLLTRGRKWFAVSAAALGSIALLLSNITSIRTSLSDLFGYGDPQLLIRDARVLNAPTAGDLVNIATVDDQGTQTHNTVVFVAQKKVGVRVRSCNVSSVTWASPAIEGWYTRPDPEPQPFDLNRDLASTEALFVLRVVNEDIGHEIGFFLVCDGVVSNTLKVTLVGFSL